VDEFLFLPVSAGMWKQHELWDGTYTLDDLLDIGKHKRTVPLCDGGSTDDLAGIFSDRVSTG